MADALSDVLAIRGLDEDKSKEVTRVYKGVRRVVDALDASFGVLHHQGWTERRERGSSAIRDNSEIVVRIKKFDPAAGLVELEHLKRRSGAGPKLKAFYLSAKLITVDGYRDQIPIVTGPIDAAAQTAASTAKKDEEDARKAEQNLILMVAVLRKFLGNKATNADWLNAMQAHSKTGWSERSFTRRLNILKARGWVRIVGGGADGFLRTAEGALYEATELAPIVAEDGTSTTAEQPAATNHGHLTTATPYRGVGGTASRGSGLDDEAPPAAPANDCHGSGGSGSTSDGGSSDQVASEDLDGSAAELIKAKKAAMERFKKNGGSKSSAA